MRVQLDPNRWLYAEIEQLKEEVERLKQAQRWIPVLERVPALGVDVLVLQRSGECEVAWRRGHDGNWSAYSALGEITHWMPLPEPPKEVQG
jgi:hypothetical protein